MTFLTSFTNLLANRGFIKAEIFRVSIHEFHNIQPFLFCEESEIKLLHRKAQRY